MTLSQRYPLGYMFFSDTGAPLAGGSLSFYEAGTTNAQAVYSDSAGSSSLGAVVTLNAAGRTTTAIYLGTANDFKEVLKSSAGATIATEDNIPKTPAAAVPVGSASAIWPAITISTSTALTTGAPSSTQLLGQLVNGNTASGTIILTLPSAVTAANGYSGIIRKSAASNTLTIAAAGGQTIGGGASISLTNSGEAALIISDGANWQYAKMYASGAIPGADLGLLNTLTAETAANFNRTTDKLPIYSAASGANASIAPAYVETARYPSSQAGSIVINMSTAAPPGSPTEFDAYVVYTGATGAWSGQVNNVAIYVNSAWKFFAPSTGYRIFDTATGIYYRWSGTAWQAREGLTTNQQLTSPFGSTFKFGLIEEEITLSGATTDSAATFPNSSVVFSVSVRVTQTITSAAGTSFTVGQSAGGGAGDFGSSLGFASGTTNIGCSVQNSYGYKVRITCTGGTFTGGKVRVTGYYATPTVATS